MTLPTVNDPSGQLARQWDIRNANAGGHFSRRGEVGHHRLDQQLGNAPAAVAGLLVDRRALAVFMPGKAYPPPGLPFGFDPVGPASAAPPGNRHLRVISRPPVQGSYPSHTTLCRSAARQWPERPLPAGRRAASVANLSLDPRVPVHRRRRASRYKSAPDARRSPGSPAPPPPAPAR